MLEAQHRSATQASPRSGAGACLVEGLDRLSQRLRVERLDPSTLPRLAEPEARFGVAGIDRARSGVLPRRVGVVGWEVGAAERVERLGIVGAR
jgi:hypothetical protein